MPIHIWNLLGGCVEVSLWVESPFRSEEERLSVNWGATELGCVSIAKKISLQYISRSCDLFALFFLSLNIILIGFYYALPKDRKFERRNIPRRKFPRTIRVFNRGKQSCWKIICAAVSPWEALLIVPLQNFQVRLGSFKVHLKTWILNKLKFIDFIRYFCCSNHW